jgi:hypothetical protein
VSYFRDYHGLFLLRNPLIVRFGEAQAVGKVPPRRAIAGGKPMIPLTMNPNSSLAWPKPAELTTHVIAFKLSGS